MLQSEKSFILIDFEGTIARYYDDGSIIVPGVKEVLKALGKGNVLRILFSNASSARREELEELGLAEYFDLVALSGESGFFKPDSRFYQYVFEKMNLKPQDGWIVDNRLENIETMLALGGYGAVVDLDQREGVVLKREVPWINHISELLKLT